MGKKLRGISCVFLSIFIALVMTQFIAAATVLLSPRQVAAEPQERTLASGTADVNNSATRWRRVNYTLPQTGPATFKLAWTGNADMRFTVYDATTNKWLGQNIAPGNPKTLTLNLQANTAYYSAIWAYSGVGTFTFTVTQDIPTPPPPPVDGRPNIVVINTDDQRADTIMHLPKIKQWLVDGGTTFNNGYVSTPTCCPSRATLMSGRYTHNNGQKSQDTPSIDLNLTTQRYLHDAGYFTGHSGKFLQWMTLAARAPHFDRWSYFKGGYENVWMNNDGYVSQSQGYSTTLTFDKALNFVDDFETRDDNKPWYLSLAPVAPHSPTTPEPQYADTAVPTFAPDASYQEADRNDKPPFVKNRNTTAASAMANRTAQLRTLYSVDDQVDRLMQHLQTRGELDNTLVIFTSDNGSLWGEHKLNSKFLPYRKSVEVPILVRWPGKVAAGAVDNRFVSHIDVAPTLLAAAGVTQAPLAPFDGRNILTSYSRPNALIEFWYDTAASSSIPNWASIRNNTYQYTEYYSMNDPDVVSFREYYDMVDDPYQLVNLYADGNTANDPAIAPLAQALQTAKACVGSSCE